jgi:hypothetical protein
MIVPAPMRAATRAKGTISLPPSFLFQRSRYLSVRRLRVSYLFLSGAAMSSRTPQDGREHICARAYANICLWTRFFFSLSPLFLSVLPQKLKLWKLLKKGKD